MYWLKKKHCCIKQTRRRTVLCTGPLWHTCECSACAPPAGTAVHEPNPISCLNRTDSNISQAVASCFSTGCRTTHTVELYNHLSQLHWFGTATRTLATNLNISQAVASCFNAHATHQCFFFSKLNYLFFGYFDPKNMFLDNKNKYFSGWPERYFG